MQLIGLLILSVAFVVIATAKLKLHPFLALISAAMGYGILSGAMTLAEVVASVNAGFGSTMGKIGIVILAGSIIGTFLERSGGALRLAERVLKSVGNKNVPMAMGLVGYVVSIPVFCDSGFVILSPLAKALSRKAGVALAASAVALSLGLMATHHLVPPTPGPVAAAEALGADLGRVILLGGIVSFIALIAGWFFAITFATRFQIEVDHDGDAQPEAAPPTGAPSASHAIVPILLPIILIVLRSFEQLPSEPFGNGSAAQFIDFLGQPTVALLIGVVCAFTLPKRFSVEMLSTGGWVGQGILAAASIIIITGAGGAFGEVLKNSGIADVVKEQFGAYNLGIWLPILIASALKLAQGSGTVAIITTASIMEPLLGVFAMEGEMARAVLVVAIGAGAMIASHANDSYFWVVTQMTGMTVNQGYKLQTLGSFFQGTVAALTVWIISLIVL
jgi:GntP family gluconate:H+ symporter